MLGGAVIRVFHRSFAGHSWSLGRLREFARSALARLVIASWMGLAAAIGHFAPALGAEEQIIARVGADVITETQFEEFFRRQMRARYYHGSIPAADLPSAKDDILHLLVDRTLLRQEAVRRGLIASEPTSAKLATGQNPLREGGATAQGQEFWQRYGDDPLLRVLREQVFSGISPPDDEVRRYYEAHPDKFTTPEQSRVSMILLGVPPYAPAPEWRAAMEKAHGFHKEIVAGGDFSKLARQHSTHESAPQGGDLGFVHVGMFADDVQQVVNRLSVGETSDPIYLLQGVALFRVTARQPARLNDFAKVQSRAGELLAREQGEAAWQQLVEKLRSSTPVVYGAAVHSSR